MKVLSVGVDSLVVGFNVINYKTDFEDLERAKADAGAKLFANKDITLNWHGQPFAVHAKGTKGYEWVIENADVSICIARKPENGRIYPELYVTFRSTYLWAKGHKKAFEEVSAWLETWANIGGNKVSRVDLCMDMEMRLPKIDMAVNIVARARNKAEYTEYTAEKYTSGLRDTGYKIGCGCLVARIYDKTAEVKVSQKEWFYSIWKNGGWDMVTPVTRIEFQLRRELLKGYQVITFEDLIIALPDIWRYSANDWVSIRVPGRDKQRTRWQMTDWWQVVSKGYVNYGETLGLIRETQSRVRYEHLMAQARGVMMSAVAIMGIRTDCERSKDKLFMEISEWLYSIETKTEIERRRLRYGEMALTSV